LTSCHADKKEKFDELVEDHGVKILIDSKALMHVLGTKMDYVEDRLKCVAPSLLR
jgi:Fe-S cluster assembly iron-binding protein IscA